MQFLVATFPLPLTRELFATVKFLRLLWPPCVADADIIFLPCGFYLSFFLLFSSPNLSGRRLDVYTILPHGVALVRI